MTHLRALDGALREQPLDAIDAAWDAEPSSNVRVRTLPRPMVDAEDDLDAPETDEHVTRVSPVIAELARIADPNAIPRKLVSKVGGILPTEASLLWSRIDGKTPLETIVEGCALPEAEALRVFVLLVERECVTFAEH